MKLSPISTAILSSVWLLASTFAAAAPLEIAGSTSVQKSIIDPVTAKAKEATGLELKMLGVGSVKGMQMLFEGRVAVAAISDQLADAVAAAKKAGAVTAPSNLKVMTIRKEQLIPIVHQDNKIAELTKDQLRGIFSGKITNWKEVGGADLPITVVVPSASAGTRGVIDKQVLGGSALSANAKELRTTTAEIAEVVREKGAIGYVGSGLAESAKGKLREVKGPDVSRPLALVTVGDPSPEVKKLFDFLQTPDAKKLFLD